ncbi:mechanosensitive ion channel family protein [Pseudocnuella soli]|uniref:mechanosensitive ion channel family protein n=1 Tax=Pseudocnuella soli TaxID=2502779 RepID=UPI001049A864|nr:mechanosensitive ion channel family protein [Pseudocnuella soli]
MNLEAFYDKAYLWILTVGPRLLIAFFVLFVGIWLIRFLKRALNLHMHRREFDPSLQPFLISLFGTVMQVMLILALMQVLGLQMTIFTALIGALGVAAGLALSGTLQNFTSGVLILLLKPFRVGDSILAQGQEGIVSSIQIFYTVVTTQTNTTVIIPNSKLSNEVIINLSRQGKRRLDIELKFNFGISFDEVQRIVQKRIDQTPAILNDPATNFGVSSVDPDGYKVMINIWVDAHHYHEVKLAFQEDIIDDLKAGGIKLPGMP